MKQPKKNKTQVHLRFKNRNAQPVEAPTASIEWTKFEIIN
jgi:hypothetical protein